MKLRVMFAGTPDFSLPCLRDLVDGDYEVVAVLTQPDRPSGRGRKLRPSPVNRFARQHRLRILQPKRLSAELIAEIESLRPDVMVVVAFGMILPPRLLAVPRYGCINVHASLLPRWRGAAPIARAIEAGDDRTGVTIMQMDAGLDTGPILSSCECAIEPCDTAARLQVRLAELGAKQLRRTLESLPAHLRNARAQRQEQATYAAKLTVSESAIDWRLPAIDIVRKIHAFNPWPVARAEYQNMTLRIWLAECAPTDADGFAAGEIIESAARGIVVAAGQGALRILCLQREGKKKLSPRDFLSGCPLLPGARFGMRHTAN